MTALAAERRVSSESSDDPIASPIVGDGVEKRRSRRRRMLAAATGTLSLGLAALYLWCPVHRFPGP